MTAVRKTEPANQLLITALPLAIKRGPDGYGELHVCVEKLAGTSDGEPTVDFLHHTVDPMGAFDGDLSRWLNFGSCDMVPLIAGGAHSLRLTYAAIVRRTRSLPKTGSRVNVEPRDFGKLAKLSSAGFRRWVRASSLTHERFKPRLGCVYHWLQAEYALDECFAGRFLPPVWSVTDHRVVYEAIHRATSTSDPSNHRKLIARLVQAGRVGELSDLTIETETRQATAHTLIGPDGTPAWRPLADSGDHVGSANSEH